MRFLFEVPVGMLRITIVNAFPQQVPPTYNDLTHSPFPDDSGSSTDPLLAYVLDDLGNLAIQTINNRANTGVSDEFFTMDSSNQYMYTANGLTFLLNIGSEEADAFSEPTNGVDHGDDTTGISEVLASAIGGYPRNPSKREDTEEGISIHRENNPAGCVIDGMP